MGKRGTTNAARHSLSSLSDCIKDKIPSDLIAPAKVVIELQLSAIR